MCVRDSKLMSANPDLGKVEYHLNEWTSPNVGCGPLCVFEDKALAKLFIRQQTVATDHKFQLFECEFLPSQSRYIWVQMSEFLSVNFLPGGTILADKIKLKV